VFGELGGGAGSAELGAVRPRSGAERAAGGVHGPALDSGAGAVELAEAARNAYLLSRNH